jgi:hypothetical protein
VCCRLARVLGPHDGPTLHRRRRRQTGRVAAGPSCWCRVDKDDSRLLDLGRCVGWMIDIRAESAHSAICSGSTAHRRLELTREVIAGRSSTHASLTTPTQTIAEYGRTIQAASRARLLLNERRVICGSHRDARGSEPRPSTAAGLIRAVMAGQRSARPTHIETSVDADEGGHEIAFQISGPVRNWLPVGQRRLARMCRRGLQCPCQDRNLSVTFRCRSEVGRSGSSPSRTIPCGHPTARASRGPTHHGVNRRASRRRATFPARIRQLTR